MNINANRLGVTAFVAIPPTLLGAFLFDVILEDLRVEAVVLMALYAGFWYAIYQTDGFKPQLGTMFSALAIELLLSPVAFFIMTAIQASSPASDMNSLGGFVLTAISFFIGLPLAGACYLISKRLE